MATVPMVAAVATDEPEIAANTPQAISVATASPPGQWPTQAWNAANRSRPTPPLSRMFDISRNSGTASRMKPSSVDSTACGAISGENPPISSSASPNPPSAKATGIRSSSRANSAAMMRMTVKRALRRYRDRARRTTGRLR